MTEITAVKAEESASEAEQHIIPTADTSTVEPGIAVKADRLYKAFGRKPHDIVKKLQGGASRDKLAPWERPPSSTPPSR